MSIETEADPTIISRVFIIVGGLFLTALSWTWFAAQRALGKSTVVEVEIKGIDKRLDSIDSRFDTLDKTIKDGFSAVHARLDKLFDSQ